jgi:hypothetical protein
VTVNRSTAHRASRARVSAGETEIARAARLLALDVIQRLDRGATRVEIWWKAQLPRTRVGLAIVSVILGASLLNFVEMRIAQSPATAPAVTQTAVMNEVAPADAGRTWAVVKMWQGTGIRDTEAFTVADHWRVDWVFNQTQAVGQMQVFIYSADGRLLNIATNIQHADANTTFWLGPGSYALKVISSGGDWKLDVQDLH